MLNFENPRLSLYYLSYIIVFWEHTYIFQDMERLFNLEKWERIRGSFNSFCNVGYFCLFGVFVNVSFTRLLVVLYWWEKRQIR